LHGNAERLYKFAPAGAEERAKPSIAAAA